nr:PEP-utilizing enzyme [Ilumatobacteraceae bacterium]
PSPATSRWRRWRHVARVISAHHRALREQAITTAAVAAVARADPPVEGREVRDLWALRHRLMALAARTAAAELAVAAAAVASSTRLEAQLVKHLGHEGVGWARAVTSELAPSTAISLAGDVAALIRATEPSVLAAPWPDASTRLRGAGHDDLVAAVLGAARRAGSRAVFTGPTWDEAPERFWDLVVGLAVRGDVAVPGHRDVDELERHLATRPGWRRTRILTGQVVDVRLILVRRLVGDTVMLLTGRESSKAALLTLGGAVRRIDLELGERLVAGGRLASRDDVVHLTTAELATMLSGGIGPTAAEVGRRRRAIERWEAEEELPTIFVGAPTAVPRPMPAGDRMQGWGASAGRHTGAVRVMRRPRPALVQPGDVVVATRTDASWTPVFLRAGALVVEEGGPLSHAAIVARELGVPAVVNVPGVVEWLRAGAEPALVTIDGDEGTIVRHVPARLAEVA